MTRLMYDSVSAASIPSSVTMVAGYVDPDGTFTWSAADWARFPSAVKVRIAGHASTNDGHVLDVEAGDATPDQAPGWVEMRRAAGVHPTVYCSEALWPTVRAQFAARGIPEPEYWIAGYPGSVGQNLYPGSVAHQYQDAGAYDVSIVADYWPGVDDGGDDVTEDQMNTLGAWMKDQRTQLQGTVLQWLNDMEARIDAHVDAGLAKVPASTGGAPPVVDYDLVAQKVAALLGEKLTK